MSPRTTIAAGLASGVAVGLATLLAAIAFIPDPPIVADASPTASGPVASATVPPSTAAAGSVQPSVVASIGEALFHVGEPAPPLSVAQLGGGQIDLANLDGRPVWINFMQTTCPPCVDEFPLMNGFAARYADTGLVVIAIDIREEEGVVAAFAGSLNAAFPIGLDTDGAAAATWGAVALPVHFWVDRDGIVRAGALGGIGPDVMAENLSTILPGVDVTP